MPNPYKAMREKLSRFNAWETRMESRLSTDERLNRFFLLYDLGRMCDPGVIRRRQEEHLQALITAGKRLRGQAGERHRGSVPSPEAWDR